MAAKTVEKQIRKMLTAVFLCLAAFLFLPIPAEASPAYSTEVENNVSIGSINIDLLEYEKDKNGKEIPMRANRMVHPGQTVDEIVRIANIANDAWVRVKIDYTGGLSDDNLDIGKEWLKKGDYWYHKKPIAHGDTIDLCSTVSFPREWDNAGSKCTIHISADAVQEKNFTPDYSLDDPWKGTVIEQSIKDGYNAFENTSGSSQVIFRGGAEGLVKTSKDFFAWIGTMMPGDKEIGKVSISNEYNRSVKIWFHVSAVDAGKLAGKIKIQIDHKGETLFYGTMDEASRDILLGEYGQGDASELTYHLYVPEELDNEYALASARVKWIFTADLKDTKSIWQKINPVSRLAEDIQTGDTLDAVFYVCILTGVLLVVIYLIKTTRSKKDDKNDD